MMVCAHPLQWYANVEVLREPLSSEGVGQCF